jgi:hypothetical protein
LIDIVQKDYQSLKYNEKDGRIPNPYTQLPPEIKSLIKISGLSYQMTMDIRSCYPSLFSQYILSLSSLPHIVYTKADNEIQRYNEIFLNKDTDPKSYLSNLLDIPRKDIKDILIRYYNGKGFNRKNEFVGVKSTPSYEKYNNWLSTNFPTLYKIWMKTDIRQTGNKIGKHFETRLMLDQSIYDKANELGIVCGYEYDGMSFYAKDNSKCPDLLRFIEKKSVELLGIQLVFVDKINTIDVKTLLNEEKIASLSEKIDHNNKRLKQLRSMCWYHKNWKPYYDLKRTTDNLLNQMKGLVECL